jgi:hypothetical protein
MEEEKEEEEEDKEVPQHERLMIPYSILMLSTCVNVKFAYRSEHKSRVNGGKSEAYKYSGSIHRKNGDAVQFSRLTLAELKEKTGMNFASLSSKKSPEKGETLVASDELGSKLTTFTGDISTMLNKFTGDVSAQIDKVNDNVLIVNDNMIKCFAGIRDNQRMIIDKLDQVKDGTVASSLSFGLENMDEVMKLRAELDQKNKIIKQKDELIALLMRQLEERK